MPSITTTTESFCRALWQCAASAVDPDDSTCGIYPDPAGPHTAPDRFTGDLIRGWRVRKMTGHEEIVLTVDGPFVTIAGASWVTDRIGTSISGRDAATIRRAMF